MTAWNKPIINPPWEQEFGNVKVVRNAVEGPLRDDLGLADDTEKVWRPPADRVRLIILDNAAEHIGRALAELEQAVSWFGVVDRTDRSDLVRQLEALAETIAYRLRNAGE